MSNVSCDSPRCRNGQCALGSTGCYCTFIARINTVRPRDRAPTFGLLEINPGITPKVEAVSSRHAGHSRPIAQIHIQHLACRVQRLPADRGAGTDKHTRSWGGFDAIGSGRAGRDQNGHAGKGGSGRRAAKGDDRHA